MIDMAITDIEPLIGTLPACRAPAVAVDARHRRPDRAARGPGADDRRELLNGLADHRSVLLLTVSVPSICSKSAERFP
jgi:hypothetical protein